MTKQSGKRQCTATSKQSGKRCRRAPAPGMDVCVSHGAGSPRSKAAAERRVVEARALEVRKTVRIEPIAETDREADPVEGIAVEYRRTIAWIRFCERQINDLREDRDIVFGLAAQHTDVETSEETKSGTEADEQTDVDTSRKVTRTGQRYEARINEWVNLLNWNRTHLEKLVKDWLAHGLDVRRLQLEALVVDQIVDAMSLLVRELGRDPADPEVRRLIRTALDNADARGTSAALELAPAGAKR